MRACAKCGKRLNQYNTGNLCYSCDDLVDDWDDEVGSPDAISTVWGAYPPPFDGESAQEYIRRLLTTTPGSVPVYQVLHHYGFDKKRVDSALSSVKRYYSRRGCSVVNEKKGAGYRIVKCEM